MDNQSAENDRVKSNWIAVIISATAVLISCVTGYCNHNAANKALKNSQTFGQIGAELQWADLRNRCARYDSQIKEWEHAQKFPDVSVVVKSYEELTNHLPKLKAPKEIIELYTLRFECYESMKRVAELYEPVRESLKRIDFKIPEPPKLPKPMVFSRGSMSGVRIQN